MKSCTISQMAVDYYRANVGDTEYKAVSTGIHGYAGARKVCYNVYDTQNTLVYDNMSMLEVVDLIAHARKNLLVPGTIILDAKHDCRKAMVIGAKVARGKHLFQYKTNPSHYIVRWCDSKSQADFDVPVTLEGWEVWF